MSIAGDSAFRPRGSGDKFICRRTAERLKLGRAKRTCQRMGHTLVIFDDGKRVSLLSICIGNPWQQLKPSRKRILLSFTPHCSHAISLGRGWEDF
jgi:hypothetical protein